MFTCIIQAGITSLRIARGIYSLLSTAYSIYASLHVCLQVPRSEYMGALDGDFRFHACEALCL